MSAKTVADSPPASPSPRTRARWTILTALLVAGGFGWRVARARAGAPPPCAQPQEEYFLSSVILRAEHVYSHDPAGEPQIRRVPLYTTFLALSQAGASRPSPSRAYAVQALLGLLAALAAWGLGERLGSPAAGRLAAAAVALNPDLVESTVSLNVHGFYGVVILVLACAAAEWAERPGDRAPGAAFGAALGVSLLCRSAHLAFLPLLAGFAFLRWGLAGLRRAALVLGIAAAVVAPWTIRNYLQTGRFVPLEVGIGSYNLIAAASGRDHALETGEGIAVAEELEPGFTALHAGDTIGRREQALLGVARRAILRAPGRYARGCLRRLAIFWRPLWPLAALAAFAALAPGASDAARLAALLAAAFSLYGTIGLGIGYQLGVEPLLTALAGVGLARLAGPFSGRKPGSRPVRLALPAAAAVTAAALACLVLIPLDALAGRAAGERKCAPASPYLLAFLDDGDRACGENWELAGKAGALRAGPLNCAGLSAYAAGDPAGAARDFDAALALAPRDPEIRLSLAVALDAAGDRVRARRECALADELATRRGSRAGPELRDAIYSTLISLSGPRRTAARKPKR